jgi:hypothetical protein
MKGQSSKAPGSSAEKKLCRTRLSLILCQIIVITFQSITTLATINNPYISKGVVDGTNFIHQFIEAQSNRN